MEKLNPAWPQLPKAKPMKTSAKKELMWDVGGLLESTRKTAWGAAHEAEQEGDLELKKKLDAIADAAGTLEAKMKGLYWKTFRGGR